MSRSRNEPAAHDAVSRPQRLLWVASISLAALLQAAFGARILSNLDSWHWWILPAVVCGMVLADFGSGLVHWAADTWGRDDLPLIGRRLLVPFRLHHIDPDDFLRRSFVDTNGDVALLTVPVLAALLCLPLEGRVAPLAVTAFAFCGVGMLTNQIHQWAHMPSPPPLVRLLQNCRLVLGGAAHAVHHERPYHARYCITTGWCNHAIDATGLFRHLEAGITRVTGAQPRDDDRRYEERHGIRSAGAAADRG